MKTLFKLSCALFIFTTFFLVSCEDEEELEPWVNENLTDTSGVYRPLDLFISGELEDEDFLLRNGEGGYSNYAYGYRKGFCDSVDSFAAYIEVQTIQFSIPSERQGSFFIEVVDCIPFDTAYQEHLDSMYLVGTYPYLNIADSAKGVLVRYIDKQGIVWSTDRGNNSGASSQFSLAAVIENGADEYSERVAFGTFSCLLYNIYGDVMEFRRGKFKGRISNF